MSPFARRRSILRVLGGRCRHDPGRAARRSLRRKSYLGFDPGSSAFTLLLRTRTCSGARSSRDDRHDSGLRLSGNRGLAQESFRPRRTDLGCLLGFAFGMAGLERLPGRWLMESGSRPSIACARFSRRSAARGLPARSERHVGAPLGGVAGSVSWRMAAAPSGATNFGTQLRARHIWLHRTLVQTIQRRLRQAGLSGRHPAFRRARAHRAGSRSTLDDGS